MPGTRICLIYLNLALCSCSAFNQVQGAFHSSFLKAHHGAPLMYGPPTSACRHGGPREALLGRPHLRSVLIQLSSSSNEADDNENDLASILTSRLPTSVEDQVRQAAESIRRASILPTATEKNKNAHHRHLVRLLLPVIGATELDDWPGGARQMMEAAEPLVDQILQQATPGGLESGALRKVIIEPSDGVAVVFAQALSAKDDSCTVLLPTAETVPKLQELEAQVGATRNLILINPQWKRRSDFGGGGLGSLFGQQGNKNAAYAEAFVPTFSLINLICEGDSIRILRTFPGPWRVYVRRLDTDSGTVDWNFVGSQAFVNQKPPDWETRTENLRDGGKLFDYGQPDYTPKNPADRAAAAFDFIKDSL